MPTIYSSRDQLKKIADVLSKYMKLPLTADTIPGAIMEALIAHIHGGRVLHTYDFVDVVNEAAKCGWQVKSTKAGTPVTWKRAKIPNADALIAGSRKSAAGRQELGNAIIDFCNQHIAESIELYGLDEIGYSRLIVFPDRTVMYFEKLLCTREEPILFLRSDFKWKWSKPKKTKKKEQLQALHGIHKASGDKWFAWHGLGENQLHFSGESAWWPNKKDAHAVTFSMPGEDAKLDLDDFVAFLSKL